MPVGKSHSIRFEINVERKIAALAAVAGISPGEMIREIVNDRVNDTDSEQIRHRLHQLESQVTAMRQDFAIAIEALMVMSISDGHLTKEEIKSWVKENLFRGSH